MFGKFNGDIKWLAKAIGLIFVIAILFGFFLHNRAEAGDCSYLMEGEENLKFMKKEKSLRVIDENI